MRFSALLMIVLVLVGCGGEYRISKADVLAIDNAGAWYQKTPEIIYVAMKSDLSVVSQLALKVPMATKDDCTCCSGGPGDAAGVVIQRLYELDPDMKITQQMTGEERSLFYRYCRNIQLIDWIDPEKPAQQGDAPEPATDVNPALRTPLAPAR